ncbi:MAG: hypothetical protein ACK5XK_08785 [Phycisphaerales bacterium]
MMMFIKRFPEIEAMKPSNLGCCSGVLLMLSGLTGCRVGPAQVLPQLSKEPNGLSDMREGLNDQRSAVFGVQMLAPEQVDRMPAALGWTVFKLTREHPSGFIGCFVIELSRGANYGVDGPKEAVGFRNWGEAEQLLKKIRKETPVWVPIGSGFWHHESVSPFTPDEIPPTFQKFIPRHETDLPPES